MDQYRPPLFCLEFPTLPESIDLPAEEEPPDTASLLIICANHITEHGITLPSGIKTPDEYAQVPLFQFATAEYVPKPSQDAAPWSQPAYKVLASSEDVAKAARKVIDYFNSADLEHIPENVPYDDNKALQNFENDLVKELSNY